MVGFEVAKATPNAWNLPPPINRNASTSLLWIFTLLKSQPITCPGYVGRLVSPTSTVFACSDQYFSDYIQGFVCAELL